MWNFFKNCFVVAVCFELAIKTIAADAAFNPELISKILTFHGAYYKINFWHNTLFKKLIKNKAKLLSDLSGNCTQCTVHCTVYHCISACLKLIGNVLHVGSCIFYLIICVYGNLYFGNRAIRAIIFFMCNLAILKLEIAPQWSNLFVQFWVVKPKQKCIQHKCIFVKYFCFLGLQDILVENKKRVEITLPVRTTRLLYFSPQLWLGLTKKKWFPAKYDRFLVQWFQLPVNFLE